MTTSKLLSASKVETTAEIDALIARLTQTIVKQGDLLQELDEYLDTNHLTSVAHGSILHQRIKEVRHLTEVGHGG